eukprot:CAMPEP_0206206814 /NCGR_PEP_ID=MMETSP0166-20121206/15212_1 /ASSEMBLY_ACC=CAM_ASM_000260 /TAXON_ID=95228 /ORGANISM="Vannella robusta, Strain DIVA3 518/3/11/1/6" /LENGTH=266 /DNA_ID=CAMNT_0053627441 /DNA_START=721 /DNA_END=1517 /DNA_ORIENTATION=-
MEFNSLSEYFWTFFLLCYNLPGLPIQILQFCCTTVPNEVDSERSQYYDERKQYILSCTLCYLCLAGILLTFPLIFLLNLPVLLIFVFASFYILAIGTVQGILYGRIFQLASLFSPQDFSSIPSCMAGIGLSTILLLVLTIGEHFDGAKASTGDVILYFAPLSVIPLLSTIALTYAIYCRNPSQRTLGYSNVSEAEIELTTPNDFVLEDQNTDEIEANEISGVKGELTEARNTDKEKQTSEPPESLLSMIRTPCFSTFFIGLGLVLL